MSFKAMYRVRASGLTDRTLVDVLEAIAFHLNDDTGLCCPSVDALSRVARVSIHPLRKAIKELEALGYISKEQKPGGIRFFAVHLEKLPEPRTDLYPRTEVYPRTEMYPRTKMDGVSKKNGSPVPQCEAGEPRTDLYPRTEVYPRTDLYPESTSQSKSKTDSDYPRAREIEKRSSETGRVDITMPDGTVVTNLPECPTGKIVELFNRILPDLDRVETLSEQELVAVKQFWAFWPETEDDKDAGKILAVIPKYFEMVSQCPFLLGKAKNSDFKARFKWLIEPSTVQKVLNGHYSPRKPARTNSQT